MIPLDMVHLLNGEMKTISGTLCPVGVVPWWTSGAKRCELLHRFTADGRSGYPGNNIRQSLIMVCPLVMIWCSNGFSEQHLGWTTVGQSKHGEAAGHSTVRASVESLVFCNAFVQIRLVFLRLATHQGI